MKRPNPMTILRSCGASNSQVDFLQKSLHLRDQRLSARQSKSSSRRILVRASGIAASHSSRRAICVSIDASTSEYREVRDKRSERCLLCGIFARRSHAGGLRDAARNADCTCTATVANHDPRAECARPGAASDRGRPSARFLANTFT